MDSLMFGHTLRMLRTAAGIGLREMAKRIHVSSAYLSQVELGKQPPPTHDRIAEITDAIGIPASSIFVMSDRPNPEVMLLLKGDPELNELIKSACDIGLESRDFLEIIALLRELGGNGFRKLIHYGANHSSDFKQPGSENVHSEVILERKQGIEYSELVNPRLVFTNLDFTDKSDLLRFLIQKVSSIYRSFSVDKVYDMLMVREAETSSGLGNGVAIPPFLLMVSTGQL